MATRKERLEARGWTIHAEKDDSWFIATNQHGIRYMLRCRRLPHSTLISLSGKWDYEDVSKIYFELIDLATTMPEAETWQEVWAEYQKGL